MSGWWQTRSLALRLTVIATVVLGVGLLSGAAGLSALFYHSRIDAVDAAIRAEEATVTSLLKTGQLPDPLPVPADQPVLAQVIDATGTVRAATPSASRVVPILPLAALKAQRVGHPFTTTDSALGAAPLRVTATEARLDRTTVTVLTAVSFTDVQATLAALLHSVLIAVPVVLLAAGIATWLAVSSALRPVDELRAAADAIVDAHGMTAPDLPVPQGGAELSRLGDTLNRMLGRLHSADQQQRVFVADAAHELRSPIASIRTQLDVALSTTTGPEEWSQVARDVHLDAERVGNLVDDLLLLTRLDSQAAVRRERVDMNHLLDSTGPPLWVEADPIAVRRAVDNLVSNARRHARTTVNVAVEQTGDNVIASIDDDGPGIQAADRERVFERWLRLDDARARDQGGAGLGLTIARSIARSHGGDVTLSDSPLGGCRALLQLPAATNAE